MAARRYAPAREVSATTPETRELQSGLRASTARLASDDRLNGNLFFSASLTPGENELRHPLRRIPQGWGVVDITGGANDIYRSAWTADTITLVTAFSSSVRLEIW